MNYFNSCDSVTQSDILLFNFIVLSISAKISIYTLSFDLFFRASRHLLIAQVGYIFVSSSVR